MVTFFLFKYKHVNLSGNSKIIIINELECIYYHEIIYSFKEYIWDAFLQNKFLSKDKCKELRKVAQMIKNLPSMQETWVRSLVWEYFLEKGMTTNSSILAWRIPWQRSLVGHSPWGCKESDTTEQVTLSLSQGKSLNERIWKFQTTILSIPIFIPNNRNDHLLRFKQNHSYVWLPIIRWTHSLMRSLVITYKKKNFVK